jgi:fluoride exporter
MLLYIAIGGGLGALVRFAVGGWVTTWAGVGYPWGTFAVNVVGSTLLGWLMSPDVRLPRRELRPLLTTGFCGGFTTFSTFDYEVLVLIREGRGVLAVTYAAASVLLCLAGVAAGLALARRTAVAGGARA